MKCKCGGVTRQINNRNNRRLYKCGNCGVKFYTLELMESDVKNSAKLLLLQMLDTDMMTTARRVLRERGYLQ